MFLNWLDRIKTREYGRGFNAGYDHRSNQQLDTFKKCKLSEVQIYVNKPVICISNEVDNPIIGFGARVEFVSKAQNPILMVRDYVTNEDFGIMGKTFAYTTQRFDAIFKLEKNELISLMFDSDQTFNKKPLEEILSKDEIVARLEENGFYKLLESYRNGWEY